MNHTLDTALITFDRAERDARYCELLAPEPVDFRTYYAKREADTGDWLVVARGGRECLRLSAGTAGAPELAERAAAQLRRRAWGKQ